MTTPVHETKIVYRKVLVPEKGLSAMIRERIQFLLKQWETGSSLRTDQ